MRRPSGHKYDREERSCDVDEDGDSRLVEIHGGWRSKVRRRTCPVLWEVWGDRCRHARTVLGRHKA